MRLPGTKRLEVPDVRQHVSLTINTTGRVKARVEAAGKPVMTLALYELLPFPLRRNRPDSGSLVFPTKKGIYRLEGVVHRGNEPDLVGFEPRAGALLQRREHVRIDAHRPVKLTRRAALGSAIDTHTLDVSAGGILIADPRHLLLEGTELNIVLSLSEDEAPLVCTGTVVRKVGERNRGIEFDKLNRRDEQLLIRFISERQASEGRLR